jgi:L-alanine-DL-glutamate epimerase-like enolase superfamily enzyme
MKSRVPPKFIEFLPRELCESGLRRDLTGEELRMVNGRIGIPQQPGLGVEIDREALAHYTRHGSPALY